MRLSAIWEEALAQTLPKIPTDLRDPSKGVDQLRSLVPDYVAMLKKQVEESDGYGSLFVTSFARGRNDDEDDRGILTLWDRYTRNEGYCVQFDIESARRMVEAEGTYHSYGWLELAEVVYGIDREEREFRGLSEQISLRALRDLYFATKDLRLTKDHDKILPESGFLQKLVSFCGKHKDPAFQDEREMRIFACPINAIEPRVLAPLPLPKTIYRPRHGPRYIVVGETILPGLRANRVLIGPSLTGCPHGGLTHFTRRRRSSSVRPSFCDSDAPWEITREERDHRFA
jgi:hypothetical protein